MIGLGPSAVSSDGITALLALLQAAADPKAARQVLLELNAKSEEAKGFLQQAKEENLKCEALRSEIEVKQAQLDRTLKEIEDKQADIGKRETSLTFRTSSVECRENDLKISTANFQDIQAVANAEHRDRATLLVKAEETHKAKATATFAEIDRIIANRKSELEETLKSQLASSAADCAAAARDREEAASILKEASELKESYAAKMSALSKLIKED